MNNEAVPKHRIPFRGSNGSIFSWRWTSFGWHWKMDEIAFSSTSVIELLVNFSVVMPSPLNAPMI